MSVLMLFFVTFPFILQAGKKPCKRRDIREDRAGPKMDSTGDSSEYEGNLRTLEEECRKEKPACKEVRRLMKATFHGLFVFSHAHIYACLHVSWSCTMYHRP